MSDWDPAEKGRKSESIKSDAGSGIEILIDKEISQEGKEKEKEEKSSSATSREGGRESGGSKPASSNVEDSRIRVKRMQSCRLECISRVVDRKAR